MEFVIKCDPATALRHAELLTPAQLMSAEMLLGRRAKGGNQ